MILKVVLFLEDNEIDINKVKLGINASVTTLSYPDKVFKGKVDKIFNVIDPETKAMQARIKLQNPGFLIIDRVAEGLGKIGLYRILQIGKVHPVDAWRINAIEKAEARGTEPVN
mgnify:CR=1 FL=1